MKTITSLAATVGIVITISSCGLGKIRQGVNKIERGMTKEQVTSLLGAPLNRSIQADQSELGNTTSQTSPVIQSRCM